MSETVYAINPRGTKRRATKRRKSAKKARRKGPSAAQLRARRKFAAMAKARAKAARKTRKRATGTTTMARRKTRKRARRSTGAMKSVHRKGGGSVSRSSWAASGYRRNRPKRRRATVRRGRRRSSYRSNPNIKGILGQSLDMVKGAGLVMAGSGVGNLAGRYLPGDASNPLIGLAKGVAVGVLVRMFGARFVGSDNAKLLAIGAVLPATRQAVGSYFPAATPFLGEVMTLPSFPGAYDVSGEVMDSYPGVSSYSPMGSYPM